MVFASFDDAFPDHPKVEGLSDAAFRLHVSAVCYCNRLLTDGHVTLERVALLVRRYRPKLLAELVEADVWHRTGHACPSPLCQQPDAGSVYIHDFLETNRSKVRVLADRARSAERQRKSRESRGSNGVTDPVTNGVSHTAPALPCPSSSSSQSPTGDPGPNPQPVDDEIEAEAHRRAMEAGRAGRIRGPVAAYEAAVAAELHRTGWKPEPTPDPDFLPGTGKLNGKPDLPSDDECVGPPEGLTRAGRHVHGRGGNL